MLTIAPMTEAHDHKNGHLLVTKVILLESKFLKAGEVLDVIHYPDLIIFWQVPEVVTE
jgi:hypothetical protein